MPTSPDRLKPQRFSRREFFLWLLLSCATGSFLRRGINTVEAQNPLPETETNNIYLPFVSKSSKAPESTPTPTPDLPKVPEIFWETFFLNEGKRDGWTDIIEDGYNGYYTGGLVEESDDPTGVKGGTVLKSWLTESFSQWPGDEGSYKRRAQAGIRGEDWYNPEIICPFPLRIGYEVYYHPLLNDSGEKWQNAVSVFGVKHSGGLPQHIISVSPRNDGCLNLQFIKSDGTRYYGKKYPNAPPWKWGEWQTIDLYIGADGLTILRQSGNDGVLMPVAYGNLNVTDYVMPGLFGCHFGLYCGTSDPSDDYPTNPNVYQLKKNCWVMRGVT